MKNFLYTALGVIVIAGALSIGAVNATTVTLNANSGNVISNTIDTDTEGKVILPNATRDADSNGIWIFEGWFASTGMSEKIGNSGDIITIDEDKTIYAHRVQTITIQDPNDPLKGFTILDRNLGATEAGTGINSYGFYYQWGNNYGFSSEPGTYPANSGTDLIDIMGEGYGPGNYYSSDKFIKRESSPIRWDLDESNEIYAQYGNLNLWGGENAYNTDEDRQGPCPEGYHIPDIQEWKLAKELWCKVNLNNTSCNGNKFREDLLLPFAGYRDFSNGEIALAGINAYYWSSSPAINKVDLSTYILFYSTAIMVGPSNTNKRANALSIRCFKNGENLPTLKFDPNNGENYVEYNIRWWEPITTNYKFIPEKEGSQFLGWYKGNSEFNFSNTTFITEDTVLKAKWKEISTYTYDANGGIFADQSSQNIIKVSKSFQSSGLVFTGYGSKKIEGASKMHMELIQIPSSCPNDTTTKIYIYNHEKDNPTIEDSYIISGTQTTLPNDIVITGDTVGLVVTCYSSLAGNRVFNIIGEVLETSGTVIEPTRNNYSFDGWYVIKNGTEIDFDPNADNEIVDRTIYARWKGNKYKISFDTDGGNNIDTIEVEYNTTLNDNILPTPTKDCNQFMGWSGLVATMPANDISLTAKWNYIGCNTSGGGSSSGGGGKRTSSLDPKNNDSQYEQKNSTNESDNTHSDETINSQNEDSESDNIYPNEFLQAYEFAYKHGITTMQTIEEADMEGTLTRIAMAKMLSFYAINVLGIRPDENRQIKFDDVPYELDTLYDNGVTLAYQLGIMGINMPDNKFRPFDEVPRGEFATALSRMLYGIADGTDVYYSTHLAKLMEEKIITNDNPDMQELRGYVMIMLMRSAENK